MESKSIAITTTANWERYWQWASYLFYPTGVIRIWKNHSRLWVRLLYTLVGLPLFLVLFLFAAMVLFALFLPPLDTSVGNRKDRTVFNSDGHYSATFLKSGN